MTFLHLNCHSDRSLGRGLIKPTELVDLYVERGVGGACITDFGNMSAAIQLYNSCRAKKIKPIVGMVVNVVDDCTKKRKESATLVLIARTKEGFYNLVKIATAGAMYFYYAPRVDLSILKRYSAGLIALSSGIDGVVATSFFTSGQDGFESIYETYLPIFGDQFYWEIQPVPTDSQRVFNEALIEFAELSPIRLVATGEPHYLHEGDMPLHRVAVGVRNYRNETWAYPYKGLLHVRTLEEMIAAMSELHGFDVLSNDAILAALETPESILADIEDYDLRGGTKIPSFVA